MAPVLDLVLLAAGRSRRFGQRKQTAGAGPNGEALCEYTVFDALQAGFGRVVMVCAPDEADQLSAWTTDRFGRVVPVAIVVQSPDGLPAGRTRPWGTGHAALAVEGEVTGPFALLNADDHYGPDALASLARFLRRIASQSLLPAWAMVGFPLRDTLPPRGAVSRAVGERDRHAYLRALRELPRVERRGARAVVLGPDGQEDLLPLDSLASLNAWGFTPALFPVLRAEFAVFRRDCDPERDEFHLPVAITAAVRTGRGSVRVLAGASEWFGLTHPEDLARVRRRILELIAAGSYPARLWG